MSPNDPIFMNIKDTASTFEDLFDSHIDYPNHIALNPFAVGGLWNYVSGTLLNGMINYVHIKRAYLINRYTEPTDVYDAGSLKVQHPVNSFNWVPIGDIIGENATRNEALKILFEKGRHAHTDLAMLGDDVLILARVKGWPDGDSITFKEDDKNKFMYTFFWFDRDCSDCSVGRFVTDLEEERVFEFDAYVKERNEATGCHEDIHEPYLIPNHFFTGWISG